MGNKGDWESAPTIIQHFIFTRRHKPWVFHYFIMLSWKPFQASNEDCVIAYKWQVLLSFLLTFSFSITTHRQHYKEKLFSGSAASCKLTWPLTSYAVQSDQEDLMSGWRDSLVSGPHSCFTSQYGGRGWLALRLRGVRGAGIFVPGWRSRRFRHKGGGGLLGQPKNGNVTFWAQFLILIRACSAE